ncbi:hypothetical protein K9M06_00930 [Candidatus Bipolaricaulota bacterium]|nr:hypothetical protein [Candidatus Bipolaricaulota bacterium]
MYQEKFGPGFEFLLDNFGFHTSFQTEVGEEFSHLIEDTYSLQTIGAFDAIYFPVPPDHKNQKNVFLSEFEERFHLYQLRKFTAGWYLEIMQRSFLGTLANFSTNVSQGDIQELQRKFAEYKTYRESVRLPLEYQIRVRYLFHAGFRSRLPLSLKLPLPFLQVPPTTEEAKRALSELKKDGSRQEVMKACAKTLMELFNSIKPRIRRSLGFSEESKPIDRTYEWIRKVLEIAQRSSEKVTPFLAQYLIEFPSFVALNPIKLPTYSGLSDEKEFLRSDPKTRFLKTISLLLELSNEKIETNLKASADKSNLYDTLRKMLLSKVLEGLPFPDSESIDLPRERAAKTLANADPNQLLYIKASLSPLISLRATEGLHPSVSGFDIVNNDPSPSIKIYKKEKRRFLIKISNQDPISKHLMGGLKLFMEGCKIIKELENFPKMRKCEYFELTGQQQFTLILKNIPLNLIPLEKQRELSQAVGIPDWPLTDKELSNTLGLSVADINELDPLFDNNLGAMVAKLWDFFRTTRSYEETRESQESHKDILAAFDDADLLGENNRKVIAKFQPETKLNTKSLKAFASQSTYSWGELIEEIVEGKNRPFGTTEPDSKN